MGEHNIIFGDIILDCINPLMVWMGQIINDWSTSNDRKVTEYFIEELRNTSGLMMSKSAVFIQIHFACIWRMGDECIVGGGDENMLLFYVCTNMTIIYTQIPCEHVRTILTNNSCSPHTVVLVRKLSEVAKL